MTLNDRERFILHTMSVMVIDVLVRKIKDDKSVLNDLEPMTSSYIENIMEDIRVGRCRKMTTDNMFELYNDMKEEMLLGSEIHKGNI
tara:strand:- start:902 stop:1162 length:261 start_codon:yes stop_codon:yes gene_type:complete